MRKIFFSLVVFSLLVYSPWEVKGQNRQLSSHLQKQLKKAVKKVTPAFVCVGGGSGVIISPDGYILTNHHVTRGIEKWLVVRPGNKTHRADLIGYDARGDIALLKIKGAKNLPYVKMADSDKIQPGQPVFAVGNPWGFAKAGGYPTVTFGVISAVHRYQGGYGDAIQIDAPINPGNSGGPTFDFQGRLLGINGQIRPRFGRRTFSGIGLAIPTNQIKNFLPALKKGGEVHHGLLPKGLKFASQPEPSGGVKVIRPAMDKKLAPFNKGDILLKIAGQKPYNHFRIQGIISTYPANSKLKCQVLRKKKILTLELSISKIPTYAEALAKGIPFRFSGTPYLGLDFGNPLGKGVEIIGVIKHSPAAKVGIEAGDILLEYNGMETDSRQMVESFISGSRFGDEVKLKIQRGKKTKIYKLTVGNTDDFPIKAYKSKKKPSTSPSQPSQPSQPNGGGGQGPGGTVTAGQLGFTFAEQTNRGVPIDAITPKSRADEEGFRKGDIITKFNGREPLDTYDLENKIMFFNSKKKYRFKILRKVKDSKGNTRWVALAIEFYWKKK